MRIGAKSWDKCDIVTQMTCNKVRMPNAPKVESSSSAATGLSIPTWSWEASRISVFVKIYSKILTLGGYTIQDGERGSEVSKRVPSTRFQAQKP